MLEDDQSFIAEEQPDMDGLMADGTCDDDAALAAAAAANKELVCRPPGYGKMVPGQLFAAEDEEAPGSTPSSAFSSTISWLTVLTTIVMAAL